MGKRAGLHVLHNGQAAARDAFVPHPSIDPSLLVARPLGLMVEYTSRCNLRCRYCTKSNPGDEQIPGRNEDMAPRTVDEVIRFLAANAVPEVLLAGTGESTFHPHWKADLPRLIRAAKAANPQCFVHFNSNMAQRYDDDAFAALAQLDGIMVSIDTADADVTREVRAKSDLGVIVYNLVRLSAYCRQHRLRLPRLVVNATVHDRACAGLPALVSLLADLPISFLTLSDMVETEAARSHGVRAVHNDDPARFTANLGYVLEALERAKEYGRFAVTLQPSLLQRLEELQRGVTPTAGQTAPDNQQGARTKLCIQPWTRFTLGADARIFPCCNTDMTPVGSLAEGAIPERDGIDGASMKRFRQDLLLGNMPAPCVDCSNAAFGTPSQLREMIEKLKTLVIRQVARPV